jgi:hypothetical protein
MNFKDFFYKSRTLLEFKSQDFYDFYALTAIQKMPNIHGGLSTKKTEYDKEIEDKIIDKGNKVIDEIIDDMSFIVLKRHMRTEIFIEIMQEKYPETFEKIPEERRIRTGFSRNWEDNQFFDIWHNFTDKDKDNIIEVSMDIYGNQNPWKEILQLIIRTKEQTPIFDVDKIVYKVNELTQLIHNNGSILEYLPNEFDNALQTRDNASTAYLASIASPSVKELIRSAGIGYLGKPEKPKYLDLIKTAMNRAIKMNFFENSYFQFEETIQTSPETESLKGKIIIPSSSFNIFASNKNNISDALEMRIFLRKYGFPFVGKNNSEIQNKMKIKEEQIKKENEGDDYETLRKKFAIKADYALFNNNRDYYPAKVYYTLKKNNIDPSDDIEISFLLTHEKTAGKQFKGVNISYKGIKNQFFNLFTQNIEYNAKRALYQFNYEDNYEFGMVTFSQKRILLDITYNIIDTHVSIVDKLETTELNQI